MSTRAFSQREACRGAPLQGSTSNPLFKGPSIRGFWTPALGLQNPSGISGPALPPWFGQDPWPEPNPSSLGCQDAYRRSTCWAVHWAPHPHPHAALGCRVRKGHGEARLQSGGETDLAKNRIARHPTTLEVFLPPDKAFPRIYKKPLNKVASIERTLQLVPLPPSSPLLLTPYLGPPSTVDIFPPPPRQTWGWGDPMTPDTPSVLQQVRSLTLISRQGPLP